MAKCLLMVVLLNCFSLCPELIISKMIVILSKLVNILQDPNNKNVVNCDEKLRRILLGKTQVELVELPALIKLHFPKEPK